MKLVVVHPDGEQERITLTEPLELLRGKQLNRLRTSTGMEHWFDHDGFYDGWGGALPPATDEATAADAIARTQADREFVTPHSDDGE